MTAAADIRWMTLALEWARRGEGLTRPNPPVGAVLVRGNQLVGAGFHRRAGGPHAEREALRAAGAAARGATLYVTLEPCSTHGRTPPCTDAILAAGIRRVVVSVADPNPRHAGAGLRLLAAAGLAVECGVCAAEGQALIEPFARWILTGRPWLTLKLGLSLDARLADRSGHSQWITGPAARRQAQSLRRRCDAILVGAGTVCADNPRLTPRPAHGRAPWRVIVDSQGRSPRTAHVFCDADANRTILATTRRCPLERRAAYARHGAEIWLLPQQRGRVDLAVLMERLGQRGCLHVMAEGGGELAARLMRARLVDEWWAFWAPCVIGGDGVPALGGAGWLMKDLPRWQWQSVERVGPDLWARLRPVTAAVTEKPRRYSRCNEKARPLQPLERKKRSVTAAGTHDQKGARYV
ncbi:MAG: bifunctional diaminohydroxyphosphoribosylaminopyrimidine deaminase/5-amino-6-(5-phosphoribosylamino)uracil reductase RibD [Candidatus Marinimicrobia bacterium]|nr:bifunctional diaminohydroxyphosphoribosylaminopyrimidine deaminase/5-amino-6-(5-phosphoribosylamino)uracil reductase RibD [Candidatus Neomarinimicrobiota bacterium]